MTVTLFFKAETVGNNRFVLPCVHDCATVVHRAMLGEVNSDVRCARACPHVTVTWGSIHDGRVGYPPPTLRYECSSWGSIHVGRVGYPPLNQHPSCELPGA